MKVNRATKYWFNRKRDRRKLLRLIKLTQTLIKLVLEAVILMTQSWYRPLVELSQKRHNRRSQPRWLGPTRSHLIQILGSNRGFKHQPQRKHQTFKNRRSKNNHRFNKKRKPELAAALLSLLNSETKAFLNLATMNSENRLKSSPFNRWIPKNIKSTKNSLEKSLLATLSFHRQLRISSLWNWLFPPSLQKRILKIIAKSMQETAKKSTFLLQRKLELRKQRVHLVITEQKSMKRLDQKWCSL